MIYKISVHLIILIISTIFIIIVSKKVPSGSRKGHNFLLSHIGFWWLFFLLELRWIYVLPTQVDSLRIISVFDSLLFLPGILLYAYLAIRIGTFKLKSYYFLPCAVHAIISLCLLAIGRDYYLFIYDQRYLKLYYGLFELGTLVFNLYFLFRSYRLLVKARNKSSIGESIFISTFQRYSSVLLTAFLIAGVAWAFRNFSSLAYGWVYECSRSVLMVGMVYLGYFLVYRWEIIRIKAPEQTPYQRLAHSNILKMKEKVSELLEEEQIFLNDQLTLSEFSKSIQASPNDLSWLLNNTYGKNFYEFLNQYRIRFFMEKIRENAHEDQTILSLALESGFRSNATFYKAFKAETGLTPNQYIKSLNENRVVNT